MTNHGLLQAFLFVVPSTDLAACSQFPGQELEQTRTNLAPWTAQIISDTFAQYPEAEAGLENADRWNAPVRANWDIFRRRPWYMGYSGFTGSRGAFMTSVSCRF